MEHLPKFSIVVASYNRRTLLVRAIESVRTQTFDDWELIIVDDASTDGTEETVAETGDARIRYVRLAENGGASIARNRGIDEAKGAYVLVWDSDDILYPDALAALAKALDEHPEAGIVSAPAIPVRDGKPVAYASPASGFVTLPQILCKYLPGNEKVRAARRELYAAARYRSRNIDFMVNVYLAKQAAWYHLAVPLGEVRIDGSDSLTRARRRRDRARSADRAEHLSAFLDEFGTLLASHCPGRYAAYAYGAAMSALSARNRKDARRWSREAIRFGPFKIRHIAAFFLSRIPLVRI